MLLLVLLGISRAVFLPTTVTCVPLISPVRQLSEGTLATPSVLPNCEATSVASSARHGSEAMIPSSQAHSAIRGFRSLRVSFTRKLSASFHESRGVSALVASCERRLTRNDGRETRKHDGPSASGH